MGFSSFPLTSTERNYFPLNLLLCFVVGENNTNEHFSNIFAAKTPNRPGNGSCYFSKLCLPSQRKRPSPLALFSGKTTEKLALEESETNTHTRMRGLFLSLFICVCVCWTYPNFLVGTIKHRKILQAKVTVSKLGNHTQMAHLKHQYERGHYRMCLPQTSKAAVGELNLQNFQWWKTVQIWSNVLDFSWTFFTRFRSKGVHTLLGRTLRPFTWMGGNMGKTDNVRAWKFCYVVGQCKSHWVRVFFAFLVFKNEEETLWSPVKVGSKQKLKCFGILSAHSQPD